MEIGKNKLALVVIDMQNSFLDSKGAMWQLGFDCKKLQSAIPGTTRLINSARNYKIPIIYTQYVYQKNFVDGGWLVEGIMPALKDVNLCVKGSWDSQILDSLAPDENDIIIEKNRPSAFISTQLDSIISAMKLESILVCGVTANMCVETTVRDSCQRDIKTFVAKDAIAEVDDDRMKLALMSMEYFFAKIMTVDEIINSWGKNK
ncbi:cysteine hydrolase [Alphaproteobacteria bacterium]|nr:cysteine hydrolase [Alphaproteobacteria bacterium]